MPASRVKLCVFHANCPDGLGAACVAWRCGRSVRQTLAMEFIGFNNSDRHDPERVDELLERARGVEVLVVDYSFPLETHRKLRAAAARLVVLDHHASAERELGAEHDAFFDMERSGAHLAWRYFTYDPDDDATATVPLPRILAYIEAYDLWQHERLPGVPAVHQALQLAFSEARDTIIVKPGAEEKETTEEKRTRYAATTSALCAVIDAAMADDRHVDTLIANGLMLQRQRQAYVRRIVHSKNAARKRTLRDVGEVIVVNSTDAVSELGNALCEAHPTAKMALVYSEENSTYIVSARSHRALQPDVDCSAVARSFGGGGHRQAAGWRWPSAGRAIDAFFEQQPQPQQQ
jgi:oligoribonuclease NrnB/cAMP/cGMP phosphodiesterase (DHH superfamily)